MNPTILLTFDVEEFDLPLEFNQKIAPPEQMEVGKKGLDVIQGILKVHNIPTTMFTTGSFAKIFPNEIMDLSKQHEIASHSLYHSSFQKSDLLDSRLVLEEITSHQVYGFRMPKMKKIDVRWIKSAGYSYDSSINPIYMPGRYNRLGLPRKLYQDNNFPRLPCSVSPNLRIPLFWLSFKNFPYSMYKSLSLKTLKMDGYLSLYFHPWEFTDLSKYKLPFYIKRLSGGYLEERLNQLITDLKSIATFTTIDSFIREQNKQ